jgi:hypothetical protein
LILSLCSFVLIQKNQKIKALRSKPKIDDKNLNSKNSPWRPLFQAQCRKSFGYLALGRFWFIQFRIFNGSSHPFPNGLSLKAVTEAFYKSLGFVSALDLLLLATDDTALTY